MKAWNFGGRFRVAMANSGISRWREPHSHLHGHLCGGVLFITGRNRVKKLLNKKSRLRNTDFLRSKIEKIVSGCKPTGSWRGRGAKPPDFEGVGSPGHAPKQPQNDHQKSRLSAENMDFLIHRRPVTTLQIQTYEVSGESGGANP